jgi:hypothetical protein
MDPPMVLSDRRNLLLVCRSILFVALTSLICASARCATHGAVTIATIPSEVRSTYFLVTVNGHRTPVMHAAAGYYLLNFDLSGPAEIFITAADAHFWDSGVELQPLRLGIRPTRRGPTIRFRLNGPTKLTIARPGDHFADAEMLFLFANEPDPPKITPQTPGIRYYAAGVHHESINAQSGDSIYLADGAVLFGSLNIWQVHDVHVFGHGTIIYDGPQNPGTDEGWMHKPDWHCIVMDNARNIEVDGITCIVRSRTWQIQMRDSEHIGYYNFKVIGGNPSDANQDGMDWLGGGYTTIRNSFFRASDDDFALEGNWDGYSQQAMLTPGHDVHNITIEDSIASTSISNTIRVNWPQKTFNSAHFLMRNMDVIHTGFGACKVPFAFFELWADPDGNGSHTDYRFENIRLEDWYSLFQIRQPNPKVRDISFTHIAALDGPAMLPPTLKGDISGVTLADMPVVGDAASYVRVEDHAAPPTYDRSAPDAQFDYSPGLLRPHHPVLFRAHAPAIPGRRFAWLFGDGASTEGPVVHHAFPDTQGSLLDGSGNFRVLLHITNPDGSEIWGAQPVVVAQRALHAFVPSDAPAPATLASVRTIDIPAEGGYTFTLLAAQSATISIDNLPAVHTPKLRPQVCGATGYAVQATRIGAALAAGTHRVQIEWAPGGNQADVLSGAAGPPQLIWQGPGIPAQTVPGQALP